MAYQFSRKGCFKCGNRACLPINRLIIRSWCIACLDSRTHCWKLFLWTAFVLQLSSAWAWVFCLPLPSYCRNQTVLLVWWSWAHSRCDVSFLSDKHLIMTLFFSGVSQFEGSAEWESEVLCEMWYKWQFLCFPDPQRRIAVVLATLPAPALVVLVVALRPEPLLLAGRWIHLLCLPSSAIVAAVPIM